MRARRRVRVHGGGDANGEKEQVVVGQLPEDFRVNTLSTADSLRHHCKLGGGFRLDPLHQCLPEAEVR